MTNKNFNNYYQLKLINNRINKLFRKFYMIN